MYKLFGVDSRVKKRVSERVSPGVMHIIRSETLGETLEETFWREKFFENLLCLHLLIFNHVKLFSSIFL